MEVKVNVIVDWLVPFDTSKNFLRVLGEILQHDRNSPKLSCETKPQNHCPWPIGGSFHYSLALCLDKWLVEREGLAYGIFIASAGASSVATPFAMEWILNTWEFETALRTWTVIFVVLITLAFVFMKSRVKDQHAHNGPSKLDLAFQRSLALWILLGNTIQSLGYFMPLFYMPSLADVQDWSSISGTIAVALCRAAHAVGATLLRWPIDRYDVTVARNLCAGGTVLAVFLL
ncbi:hypothetical protein N8T08_004033 [Aspergillus melleus]|uniref:Uncharacterized protein n=1 Tax=Aspergillus melleus TaxID=138277 RepID=A0ACC3B6C7_9EURO|nr:hypothetical protein N8T08_004033 [Aspergillus melleus]